MIDDTDGQEVEAAIDEEPTSAIPEAAVAEGEEVDVADPSLADIMADDGPGSTDVEVSDPAPVTAAPVAAGPISRTPGADRRYSKESSNKTGPEPS